jgi:hypothetical protein
MEGWALRRRQGVATGHSGRRPTIDISGGRWGDGHDLRGCRVSQQEEESEEGRGSEIRRST